MASPLVGLRAGKCPQCGSAEVYLRADGAPQCRECKWTGPPRYDSKYLQSWSATHLPPETSPLPRGARRTLPPEARTSGGLFLGGGVACALSIPLVFLLRTYLDWLPLPASSTWDAVVGNLLVVAALALQVVYAVVALIAAGIAFRGNATGGPVFALVGAACVGTSIFLFGGVFGIAGGALILAGALGMRRLAEYSAAALAAA